jgi:DNA-binding transcriptional regulator LsrR (DeoR family)
VKEVPSGDDETLSDALVFEVAKRWLLATGEEQKKLTTGVAEWLVDTHGRDLPWLDLRWTRKRMIDLTRYRIYKIVRQGIERDFVQLHPPQAVQLREKLMTQYKLDPRKHDINVVDVAADVNNMVARQTAEVALQIILKLARRNLELALQKGLKPEEAEPVGIGLGAGYSSLAVVSRLAKMIEALTNPPRLRLHALTSTIAETKISPVTFLSLFAGEGNEYVDLPTAATVRCREFEALKDQDTNIRTAFKLREKVQLIITSLGNAEDPHGTLGQYQVFRSEQPISLHDKMVGDLQYLPYGKSGVIPLSTSEGWRAVTLFDWPDLLKFAEDENHYLVICAAPCRQCKTHKTPAIIPLLEYLRIWTHLVTDRVTAEQLLAGETDSTGG